MAKEMRKLEFRVQYRVKSSDSPITMRVRTETLEELHRLLCGMASFKLPVKDWHELEIHETLLDGSVAIIPKEHLAESYDWKYGFKFLKAAIDNEEKEEARKVYWTAVISSKFRGGVESTSSAGWWKEKEHAY